MFVIIIVIIITHIPLITEPSLRCDRKLRPKIVSTDLP